VPDGHDGVGVRDRVVGQGQASDRLRANRMVAGEVEHRWGRVGSDDLMARIDEVLGEQPTAASELHDKSASLANGLEQCEHARCAVIGVEREAQVMDQREIRTVVGGGVRHLAASSHRPTR
jgi:hypothetical protein